MTKNIKKNLDDVREELADAFTENNDLYDIAKVGLIHLGYENMNVKALESEYEEHFGIKIEIVELSN